MLDIFDKKYKAISNLFITNYLEEDYVYPSPFSAFGTLEDSKKSTKDQLTFTFESFDHSIFSVDGYFNIFFYLLTFEYSINTIYIDLCYLKELQQEAHGSKGVLSFIADDLTMNLEEEIEGDTIWRQHKKLINPNMKMFQ